MEPGGRVSSTRTRGPPLGLRRGLPRRAAPPLLLLLPLLLLGLLSACGVAGAVPEGPRAEAWADEQRSFLSKTRSAGSRGGLAQAAGPLLRGSQRQVLALVPPSEEQGPSGSRLLQGSSSTPGATGLDPAAIRAAPNSSSFFALLRDPRVTLILLPFDLTLRPEDATRQPILLNRNVTVWGGPQAAALAQAQAQALAGPSSAGAGRPPAAEADTPTPSPTAKGETGLGSSSLMDAVAAQLPPPGRENDTLVYVTLLSWEFLAARVKLASGVVLTLRDVLLYRVNSRLSAHLAFMAASGPGSVVRLERVVQQRVSCIPLDMALQAQRQKVPWNESLRLTPGLLPSLLPLPAPPGYTPGFQPAPGAPDLELFTGTLCAVTSPTTDDEPGAGQQQALTAAGASASTAVSPPPGVPAGQAVCRSPYLRVQDAAYAMQVLDSTLADNGGYRLVYNDSFVFCDFPVARACIDVQGPERCVTDELAKHQGSAGGPVSAAAGPGGQGSGAGGGGRAKQARQALGLGLGLGLGVPLLLVSALGLACLLLTGRRAPLTPPYVKPPLQSEPLEPGGLSTPMEVTEDSFTGSHRAPTAAVELAGAEGVLLRGASSSGLAAAEVKSGSGSQHSKGQGVLQQGPAQQQRRSLAQEAAEASGRLMQLETAGVEAVVRQLAASRREVSVQVLEPLGQGSFARVYKASWQGSIVALKVLTLPASLSTDAQWGQVAVMEAAVSSVTSHPNLVQTYSYSFREVLDSTHAASVAFRAEGSSGRQGLLGSSEVGARPHGYELHLVLEYCDLGTLRQALDRGAFHRGMPGATATPAGSEGGGGHVPIANRGGLMAASPFAVRSVGGAGGMPRPHAYGGGPFGGCRGIPEGEGAEESTTASARTLVAPPPAPLSGGGLLPARSISDRSCAGQSPSAPAVLPSVSSSSAPALSARPRPALRYSLMLALAADTASALLHLHANGIVHGDVKASNVLLKSGAGAGRTPSSTGASTGRAASTGPTATQSTGVPTSSTPLVPRRASQPGGGQGLAVPAASNGPLTAVGSSTELTFVTALGSGFGSDIGTSVGPETGASGGRGRLARAGERGASSAGGVPQGLSEPGNGPAVPPAGAPRQSTACGSGGSSTTRARAEDPHERLLPSGVVAKLSDFGLATHIDDGNETHVSALAAQGTLTHMAPELLLHGHISKHADTYAYGIMLYELLTADKAHRGQPRALLPHMVALKGLRPSFPAWAPPDYRALAESCWAAEPRKRPDFASILSQLQRMREEAAWAEAARPGAGGWMEVEVHALQPPSGGGGRPSSSLVLGSAEMADLMASTVAGIDAGAEAVGSG